MAEACSGSVGTIVLGPHTSQLPETCAGVSSRSGSARLDILLMDEVSVCWRRPSRFTLAPSMPCVYSVNTKVPTPARSSSGTEAEQHAYKEKT